MSETDAPLTYYELVPEKSQQWPPSTVGQFLQLIGEDPAAPVEKLAPEKFFRDLRPGNEDHEDQVAALRKAMRGCQKVCVNGQSGVNNPTSERILNHVRSTKTEDTQTRSATCQSVALRPQDSRRD